MRAAGLLCLLALTVTSLGSFRLTPRDPALPSIAPPESFLRPLPFDLPPDFRYLIWVIQYVDELPGERRPPVWLVMRTFDLESAWNRYSDTLNANGTRDVGIAKLNSRNLVWFAGRYNGGQPIDPRDPETSIRVGVRYLADLYLWWGSWREAVRKYAGNRPERHTRWIVEGR